MKYLSLILLLLFITIVSIFTGCCCNREGLGTPPPYDAPSPYGSSTSDTKQSPDKSKQPSGTNLTGSTKSPNPLCCTKWQQTLNCDGHGPLDTNSQFLQQSTHGSHKCDVALSPQVSGFCVCKDGSKKYFNCGELGGQGQPQNCDDACKGVSCQPKSPLTQHIGNIANPLLGKGVWNSPLPVQHSTFISNKSK
jgi:hypothetical protein